MDNILPDLNQLLLTSKISLQITLKQTLAVTNHRMKNETNKYKIFKTKSFITKNVTSKKLDAIELSEAL